MTGVYNPKAFILHAASHCQAFAHCKWSSTAASRRSLGSVSVPVRVTNLSVHLAVSLGKPLPYQLADGTRTPPSMTGPEGSPPFKIQPCGCTSYPVLAFVSKCCPRLRGSLFSHYSPFRHYRNSYIAIRVLTVRLACLIHAASVRSEPESNSPKKKFIPVRSPSGVD